MFKRHGIKRLAATILAALTLAGVLAAGTAAAADTPPPAATRADVTKAEAAKPAKPAKVEKSYEERRAADGPWARGADWMQFGAGYARAGGKNAGDGLGGYGIGYRHMISDKWSFGAAISHEILGHLGPSYEISVPFTAEFVRHFKWKTVMRPYLGVGGGYYFHKYYRTASDYTGAPGAGWHLCVGTNLPIDDRHVIGVDARGGFVDGRGETVVNPVFGPETASMTQWSIKLNWAMVHQLKALLDTPEREWVWTRPKLLSRGWELRAGDEVVATLESRSWLGVRMTGENAAGRWELRHEGLLRGRTVVRPEAGDAERLVFRPGWFGAGEIRCASGATFAWKRGDFWGRRWRVLDADGHVQLEFLRRPAFLKSSASVEATDAGRKIPEIAELAMLGFFLLRLLERQAQAAH